MAEHHPTIPGVTVRFETLHYQFVPQGKDSIPYEVRTLEAPGLPRLIVDAWRYPVDDTKGCIEPPFISDPSRAETVIAMIRDQVDWLKQQEAPNE